MTTNSTTIQTKARIQKIENTIISGLASIALHDYTTLAEFKSETIIDYSDYTDVKLQEYIDRAQEMIDVWLGSNIGYTSQVEKDIRCIYDYPKNGLAIQLSKRPIINIDKIIVTFGPSSTLTWETTTQLAKWRINEKIGYVEYFGLDLSDYVLNICLRDPMASNIIPMAEITYRSGHSTIPTEVHKAIIILTEQLIRNDQGDDIEITSVAIGNYREGYKRSKGIKSMGIIGGTDQVERLLRPYRQPNQTMFTKGPYG